MLGTQSVPDGLASGLLAGVNPLFGLHAYLLGTIAGAVSTSSAFMVVQGTGAMAMVIADVPAVHDSANRPGPCSPSRSSRGSPCSPPASSDWDRSCGSSSTP